MEAWQKASTPGEQHQLLQRYVGRWEQTVKWWSGPDAEPEMWSGTSEIEPIFGGRYLRQKVQSTSMGMPFEGLSIVGYDNVQGRFTSFWIDNMGTGTMNATGVLDEQKRAIVQEGTFSCPLTPSGKQTMRSVWTLPEEGVYRYEMFGKDKDGKQLKMMEIIYRKAS